MLLTVAVDTPRTNEPLDVVIVGAGAGASFRQWSGVIAGWIDSDRSPIDEYREKNMCLEDRSCCELALCNC